MDHVLNAGKFSDSSAVCIAKQWHQNQRVYTARYFSTTKHGRDEDVVRSVTAFHKDGWHLGGMSVKWQYQVRVETPAICWNTPLCNVGLHFKYLTRHMSSTASQPSSTSITGVNILCYNNIRTTQAGLSVFLSLSKKNLKKPNAVHIFLKLKTCFFSHTENRKVNW